MLGVIENVRLIVRFGAGHGLRFRTSIWMLLSGVANVCRTILLVGS